MRGARTDISGWSPLPGAARRGFESAPPAERAAFAVSGTCAITLGVARVVTYVQERRRPAPHLRSLVRRVLEKRGDGVRVHHYLPGMWVSGIAGAAAILTRDDDRELWFSIPFGIGGGLVLDETALLLNRANPYWGSKQLVLIEGAAAALTAAALGARFLRRGAKLG